MTVVVSQKGQVTIPKPVREKLGITPGTILEFAAEDGRLVGQKQVKQDVFTEWQGRGRLPEGMSVDEYIKAIRDVRQ